MGLNDFILTCEKDNKELREDVNYYKNMVSRLKKENQELMKTQSNWNELKNYLEKQIIDSKSESSQQYYFNTIYKLMQELEQGSDSDE